MRTAYCPKSHTELASASNGNPYGHVPGHQYRDVDVVVSARGDKYRVHVVESWGSAQGYDEEHGRREVIGRGESVREAVEDARQRAKDAGIGCEWLEQSLTQAQDAAEEAIEDAANAEPTLDYFTTDGSVRGCCGHKHSAYEQAQRCIDRDQAGCASQGGYSDRHVVAVDSDGSRRRPSESEAGV